VTGFIGEGPRVGDGLDLAEVRFGPSALDPGYLRLPAFCDPRVLF
jgi:hypothetical protein